ncbi:MAG: methyltransferase domain-containing protein [Pseudomonadota bacterium]
MSKKIDNLAWDRYYTARSATNGKVQWYSEEDIKQISQRYGIDQPFAMFIWSRTEHSVRTYELMEIKTGYRVLELGCGGGAFTAGMILGNREKQFQVSTTDFSPLSVERTRQNLTSLGIEDRCQFIVADATELPFPDNLFDIVIAPSVIEHIPEQRKAISEMSRVCRMGGRIIISTDNTSGGFATFGILTFLRWGEKILRRMRVLRTPAMYCISNTPSEIKRKFKNAGLEISFFEFTHFSVPFFRKILDVIKLCPNQLKALAYNLFVVLESRSRKSRYGCLHPMFIIIGRKG